MELNEYQKEAQKTARYPKELNGYYYYLALALAGEVGELCNLIKKIARDGIEPNREEILSELGDILWYTSELARQFGFTLEEVAKYNLEKLRKRYLEKG